MIAKSTIKLSEFINKEPLKQRRHSLFLSFLKKHGLTHAHLCCFPLEPCTTICVLVILACSGHANLPVSSPQYIYHPAVVMPEFKAPALSFQATATVPFPWNSLVKLLSSLDHTVPAVLCNFTASSTLPQEVIAYPWLHNSESCQDQPQQRRHSSGGTQV